MCMWNAKTSTVDLCHYQEWTPFLPEISTSFQIAMSFSSCPLKYPVSVKK